jgi:YHS domain-containing protein
MYVSENNAITKQINGQTIYFCGENCAREYERKNR